MRALSHFLLASVLITLCCSPAFAHPGHGLHNTVMQGFLHPSTGIDHILAMISVGVLAFAIGGRGIWTIPLGFLAMMTAGAVVGATGIQVPEVEQGIAASVLVLGIVIALAVRLPLPFAIVLTGVFAVFHGLAHGMEGPAGHLPLFYFSGFLLATALLHGAGIGLGAVSSVLPRPDLMQRGAGVAVGLAGLLMLIG